jgi:phosphatidate cytidylyltransferase
VLKQRVLTAVLLLPLVMAAIFALPPKWLVVLLALILLKGSAEYARLAAFSGRFTYYLLIELQLAILIVLFIYREYWGTHAVAVLSIICLAWLLMFARLLWYRADDKPGRTYRVASFLTAIISITTGWFAISWLRMQPDGAWLILLLLLIVWAADTGAYFAGRRFGNSKLAPQISPGKTRAGLYGGLLLAPLVALLAVHMMPIEKIEALPLILLSLVTALVSVGGDLLISMHKRTSGFKDSGNLLPGHGGVLDRLDSLLAAAPFFALGLLVAGH